MTKESSSELKQIVVADVKNYLQGNGWREGERFDNWTLWTCKTPIDTLEFEVVVPDDEKPSDYALRIADLAQTVGLCHGIASHDVIKLFLDKQRQEPHATSENPLRSSDRNPWLSIAAAVVAIGLTTWHFIALEGYRTSVQKADEHASNTVRELNEVNLQLASAKAALLQAPFELSFEVVSDQGELVEAMIEVSWGKLGTGIFSSGHKIVVPRRNFSYRVRAPGFETIEGTVDESNLRESELPYRVTVSRIPVEITLKWDDPKADLDLYVGNTSIGFVEFRRRQIYELTLNNDIQSGAGEPERISIMALPNQELQVRVHCYGAEREVKGTVTVTIAAEGDVSTETRQFTVMPPTKQENTAPNDQGRDWFDAFKILPNGKIEEL